METEPTVVPLEIEQMTESEAIGAINAYGVSNSIGQAVGSEIAAKSYPLSPADRKRILDLINTLLGGG